MIRILSLFIAILLTTAMLYTSDRLYSIYDAKTGEKLDITKFARLSTQYDVIFFGEFHDDSIIHYIQKEYLQALYDKFNSEGKKLAVSMEMFERDVQSQLNNYMDGKTSEEDFLKASRPWPDYKDFYKPLVELAKSNNSPVIAANIPRKYAGLYAREGMQGIDTLNTNDRKLVTRNIDLTEDGYYKNFRETMLLNLGLDSSKAISVNQENTMFLYFGAQVIKDETMAESIADFLKTNKNYHIIHFNGDFHSNDYLGTVSRLVKRDKNLKIAVISPKYVEENKPIDYDSELKDKCDFSIVLTELKQPEMPKGMMGGHLSENYIASHKIDIHLSPAGHHIEGSDNFKFKNPVIKKSSIKMLKDLNVTSLTSPEGKIEYESIPVKDDPLFQEIVITIKEKEISNIIINYRGYIYHSPNVTTLNQRHSNSPGIISDSAGEGIYLPGGSYAPMTENDLADFDITVTLPKDLTIITSGKLESKKEVGENAVFQYKSELPADDFILVGGKYIQTDTIYDGKKFSAFMFSSNPNTKTYLDASLEYYKLYTRLLGPYPYSGFSIVENFFATGFGMPQYTLLSNRLMALPWILLSPGSLAHEFIHNWWGNSVYVDYERGNWCEALTTYCTNYYYNVLGNRSDLALDWRKKALLSISDLNDSLNYPVIQFKYQRNNDDATIGYQKGGFIFYEVMKLMGEDSFFNSLKSFAKKYKGKRAYWNNLTSSFDEQIKKDSMKVPVKDVMNQWLNQSKIPTLKIGKVESTADSISFEIIQDLDYYMSVPVIFGIGEGYSKHNYIVKEKVNKFKIAADKSYSFIQIDPEYQVLRKLYNWEIPFSFNQVISDNPLLILPSKKSADYKVAEQMTDLMKKSDYKFDFKSVDDLKDEDWSNRSIIIVGDLNSNKMFGIIKDNYPKKISIEEKSIKLNDKIFATKDNILLLNCANPKNPEKYMTVIYSPNLDSIDPVRRLFHYMSYSMVFLDRTKSGKPLSQMEIFPTATDKKELKYILK